VPYCTVALVKVVLQIDSADETFDNEIEDYITSADALVDSLLKQKGSAVPATTPQNIIDASKYFAAWLFRRPRDPVGAEAFWEEANKFLDAFVDSDIDELEVPFRVCCDD
jgi:hypothetical protein